MLHNVGLLMRNISDFVLTGQLNAANIDLMCDEYRAPIIDKKEFVNLYKRLTKDYSLW